MDGNSRETQFQAEAEAMRAALRGLTASMAGWTSDETALPDLDRSDFSPETADVLVALHRVVGQRIATQRRLQQGIEALRDGFAVFDRNLRFVSGNKAFRNFFQPYTSCPEGVSLLQLTDIAIRRKLILVPFKSGREWVDEILTTLGQPFVIGFSEDHWVKLVFRQGREGDLILLVSDITNSVIKEKQLERARLRAVEAGQARAAFLANMSHELRTPLNGVIGMAELLCDSGLDDERRQLAETIRSSADALLGIINDVLDFSRGEAREIELRETDFDLESTASEVITLLSRQATCKGLEIQLSYDPFLSPMIHGDRSRLRQVLINLVGNAIKFTPSGSIEVQILENRRSAGIEILVIDSGLGVPDEEADRIFEEFSQIGDERSAATPGTGLGLAISNQIVSAMGGRLWMSSIPGQGSVFGISLPVLPERSRATPLLGRSLLLWSPRHERLGRILRAMGADLWLPRDRDLGLAPSKFDAALFRVHDCGPLPETSAFMESLPFDLPRIAVTSAALTEDDRRPFDTVLLPGIRRSDLAAAVDNPVISHDGRLPRILAADDNATNRLVLQKMIGDRYALVFAEDGEAALRIWHSLGPDLVLMDISMPLMDGKEATRRIRQIEAEQNMPRTPILALTAFDSSEEEAEIMQAGVDDVLSKPIRRQILMQKLARHLTPETLP